MQGLFEGCPPNGAWEVEPLAEPVKLNTKDRFSGPKARKTGINMRLCNQNGLVGIFAPSDGKNDSDMDVMGVGGKFNHIRRNIGAGEGDDVAGFDGEAQRFGGEHEWD